ncbi:MAG: hypothetical protein AAFP69_13825 [Planctomycetota bacterium]
MLLQPSFSFHFAFDCHRVDFPDVEDGSFLLPETCRLPQMGRLGGQIQRGVFAIAWRANALALQFTIQKGSMGSTKTEIQDAIKTATLIFMVDTRCSPGIHRATKFCHQYWIGPHEFTDAVEFCAMWKTINRARASVNSCGPIQY